LTQVASAGPLLLFEHETILKKAAPNAETESERLDFFDPARGGAAFRLSEFESSTQACAQRANYFTVFIVQKGNGTFHADLAEFPFRAPCLLFANPYQRIFFSAPAAVASRRLDFHANFFCIETYHEEVGCNGVLFNEIYGSPVLPLNAAQAEEFNTLGQMMEEEAGAARLAHSEALLSYLKVFLIKATRIKMALQTCAPQTAGAAPEVLNRLIELVELKYNELRRPSEYARLLGISEKALNKLVRRQFGQSLTLLIRDRVMKHAKWHLLHTRKAVKEVAAEAGFEDVFYFSRLFKQATGMAPSAFREFETAIRGGRNLSM
jgi:AraC-like DNA-binding protein